MFTAHDLAALRTRLADHPETTALLATLRERAAPVIATMPHLPRVKALLSRDGGFCPDDGTTLAFDPWSPDAHRCPRCGRSFSSERHYLNWTRAQHLWLAERAAELALIGAITDDAAATARANELLALTAAIYFELPNRDNVLGPTRLFFSTYLESVWVTSWLAAAMILREHGTLDDGVREAVDRVADEAANIIASFNEGLSNRQTWHAAALTAIGAWFDDQELVRESVESRTGLLGHLADGFGDDGLWYEGENYHLFALRGLMIGMQWARAAGVELLGDPALRAHFHAALLAPARSALPDLTYPARRDARYGVSLAQPASLDLWEIGRGWLEGDAVLESWLAALYAVPGPLPPAEHNDYWLHDAGRSHDNAPSRAGLSWWALPSLLPPPDAPAPWQPAGVVMSGQGLTILRSGGVYASLECGAAIGGHGHPDRLHCTLHANGVHWLPDQGTGSYVHPTLAWYRSDLAHNAPVIAGRNCGGADARLEAFDQRERSAWCRGSAGDAARTIVLSDQTLIDRVDVTGNGETVFELPWHLQGELEVATPGHWEPARHTHSVARDAERFVPDEEGSILVLATHSGATLRVFFHLDGGELLRLTAPGLPVAPEPRPFLLLRGKGHAFRWITVLDFAGSDAAVEAVRIHEETVELVRSTEVTRCLLAPGGVTVTAGGSTDQLGGIVPLRTSSPRATVTEPHPPVEAFAPRIEAPPALDGTLAGFDLSEPLELTEEHQYRRSEEPYDPDRFTVRAWLNRDDDALYLAVGVSKPMLVFRPGDAPPLLLDNESDDIHSDGVQLHWHAGGQRRELLVIPDADGRIRVRPIGAARQPVVEVTGTWQATASGYLVTLRLCDPAVAALPAGSRLRFDLLVNEMQPERQRRAGQLVWGGSGGWIYLRGDRHDLREAGVVTLG